MTPLGIALHYGKTLFEGTQDRKTLAQDLEAIMPFLLRPELQHFFASPIVPYEKKEELLTTFLNGKIHPFLLSFFLLLLRKKRWNYFKEIIHDFLKRREEEEGFVKAFVTTAAPLDEENKGKLLAHLKGAYHPNLTLEEKIDSQLLGGAVLKIDHTLWDGSVLGMLNHLKERLLTSKLQVHP